MKLGIEPVKRCPHILDLTFPMRVFALAEARAPEIKAQYRETKTVQRFHGMKHDFVMQRPAKQRMRMANQRGMRGVGSACIEQGLEFARRTIKKKRANR